jgi:hypothetical protein
MILHRGEAGAEHLGRARAAGLARLAFERDRKFGRGRVQRGEQAEQQARADR